VFINHKPGNGDDVMEEFFYIIFNVLILFVVATVFSRIMTDEWFWNWKEVWKELEKKAVK